MRPPLRALIVALGVATVFVLPTAADLVTDWWWFAELGQQDTYARMLSAQGLLGVLALVVSAGWLTVHLRLAARTLPVESQQISTPEGLTLALPARNEVQSLGTGLALAAAVLLGLYGASSWREVVGWRHAVPFEVTDPVLGFDVAFYVFTLPVLQLLRSFVLLLIAVALVGAGGTYLLAGQLAITPFGFRLALRARRHLGLLVALGFVAVAAGAWLSRPETLLQPTGLIRGAGYTDVHARFPFALAEAGVALVAAGLVTAWTVGGRTRHLAGAVALYAVTLVAGQVYAEGLQRFVVTPNEQAREAPFIQHNIDATRRAFALDTIAQRPLTGDAELTRADIEKNRATLDNVRLWDHQPLLETFGQIQEIRTYYDFTAVDNDRYEIDGQMRQVMLSARELNPDALPNRTWVNERLTFTHGHGLTLGPVNQVTAEGLPVLFIRDLPPVSTVNLPVSEPSLYFGELSNEYAVVRTKAREFHYPKGDDNVFSTYDGRGGIVLDSLVKKLAFAVRFRAYQLLLSEDITPESRLMFDRQVKRRAQKLAPFLQFDDDPYVVVHDGRLMWMLDGYTVTSRYPYATEGAPGVSYIRNAAKVVIDAYHGTTSVYLAEPDDPIARAYAAAFPALFKPLADMPAGLRAHVRYPEGIFGMQASVYATYHMTSAAVFYNKEDQWEVPSIDASGQPVRMAPYYTIMKLPGEGAAEFIQMLPFTPRRRDNLASWLVARSDGAHYGQLMAFEFPKQKLVFGPRQVVARINQDQVISPQITLWNQQGSEVIQGTLMVIPIEESLLYVRPLYLRAQQGRIPELTRVIVAYQTSIVMERTLDAALARLFSPEAVRARKAQSKDAAVLAAAAALAEPAPAVPADAAPPGVAASPGPGAPAPAPPPPLPDAILALPPAALAAEAQATYQRALEAQRAGDWAKYGAEIGRLGQILERLNRPR
ncbi:MAG: UPF0182 family protein [Candidatus Binatia bacterium]